MANETETKPQSSSSRYFKPEHGWLYGLLVLIVGVLIFIAGMAVANHHNYRTGFFGGGYNVGMFGRHGGMMGLRSGLDGTTTINGQTRIKGVVTSVNGSSFTIAGNGSTTNVTTSSSTQYQGGNQVKQNDTVTVFGTTSNNTLSATEVVINP